MPRWWRELATVVALFVLAVVTSPVVRADSPETSLDALVTEEMIAHADGDVSHSAHLEEPLTISDSASEKLSTETHLSHVDASSVVDVTAKPAAALPAWRTLTPPYSAPTLLPVSGKAMYYNPGVMATVLESRTKYDQIEPCERCIGYVAMLRYGDLNRKVWLQMGSHRLEGPFHVVDVAATQHVGQLLARDWVVDVDYQTALRWNMRMPYVTIWENPPLVLLLARWTLPIHWHATLAPAEAFTGLPQSRDIPPQYLDSSRIATKQVIQLRDRNMRSYVDLAADLPLDLYVK